MSRVRFAAQARIDLNDIGDYIARDNPISAAAFLETIIEKCEALAEQPLMGRKRSAFKKSNYRSFPVGNYVIFYEPTQNGIVVARVLHGARDINELLG